MNIYYAWSWFFYLFVKTRNVLKLYEVVLQFEWFCFIYINTCFLFFCTVIYVPCVNFCEFLQPLLMRSISLFLKSFIQYPYDYFSIYVSVNFSKNNEYFKEYKFYTSISYFITRYLCFQIKIIHTISLQYVYFLCIIR